MITTTSELDDLPSDFALLVNARVEKGFGLLLAVAALCPDIPFVTIASQSSAQNALIMIREAGLTNVSVIRHTDKIAELYGRARVVLVPSYHFLETFSRVCIEAQRYAKPVLGSNTGNVPFLLQQSGTILPEDPDAWAARLRELYDDENAYSDAQRLARENSERYSEADQSKAFARLVGAVRAPLLIGIGSGIGNMLHVGPMIRNIARRRGAAVDLVVSQDHTDSLFLLDDPQYVNSVHALHPAILNRHYDTVFITHSFGGTRVPFSCDRLLQSRDWKMFAPGQSEHETIFNLEAAKALLGIDYDPADAEAHYLSDLRAEWSDGPVVGLHGGSKPGYWSSKRWPHFPELTARLKARGFHVVCYGTPDEAIEGAEDRTGGTIAEMARDMRRCSWFVSNDSGLMNMANALGIPVLGIFAPTDVATRRPLSAHSRTISVTRDCSPCEVKDRKTFKSGQCDCIALIDVKDVLDSFDAMRAQVLGLEDVPA